MQESIRKYNTEDIFDYLNGKMSAADMHAIEKAALDDPFLSEVIDGLRLGLEKNSRASLQEDIHELKSRIKSIEKKSAVKPVAVPVRKFPWFKAAAILIAIAGIGSIVYLSGRNFHVENKTVSIVKTGIPKSETEKKVDTQPQPQGKGNTDSTIVSANTVSRSVASGGYSPSQPGPAPAPASRNTSEEDDKKKSIKDDLAPAANEVLAEQKSSDTLNLSKAKAGSALSAAKIDATSFSGRVLDENNQPVSSAALQTADKKIIARTDSRGMFNLRMDQPATSLQVDIASIGYEPTSVVFSNGLYKEVRLRHQRLNNLQEVVATIPGQGNSNKASFLDSLQEENQSAAPAVGWKKYKVYLSKHIHMPDDTLKLKGVVWVSFNVDAEGNVSNFRIEKSLEPNYDEEAIRLISEGPKWKWIREKTGVLYVKVDF